jgi:hypothetical protein
MYRFNLKLFSNCRALVVFFGCVAAFALVAATSAQAQRSKGSLTNKSPEDGEPTFHEFRGVRIGMAADEARKKLGTPRDKSAEQDFYVFNDTEAVQVYYDKTGAVTAISVDFMSGANGVPTAKEILGSDAEAKADGSIFKRVDYPKAGYWVSYSRTAGSDPTTTITIQKSR